MHVSSTTHTLRLPPKIVALALALLVFPAVPPVLTDIFAQNQAFHFRRYIALSTGDRFAIIASTGSAKNSQIGSGKVRKRNAQQLELDLQLDAGVNALVQLRRLSARSSRKYESFELHYTVKGKGVLGATGAADRAEAERVKADSFLARNGILAIHFADGKRFVQLSIDRQGRSVFISHWGATRLRKLN